MRNPDTIIVCKCGRNLKFLRLDKGYEEKCGKCRWREKFHIIPWNKGQTKETNEKVREAAQHMKDHYEQFGCSRAGRTKETHESILTASRKISQKLKSHYATHTHWSKGLTNETSQSIAIRSKKSGDSRMGRKASDVSRRKMADAKRLTKEEASARFLQSGFRLDSDYESSSLKVKITCTVCENSCQKTLNATNNGSKCPTCHPPWSSGGSAWQDEIYVFVQSMGFDTVKNDRSVLDGFEIDVLVPSQKVGIECNGLYWHSVKPNRFGKNHVNRKTAMARDAGYSLMTFFEDEWEFKRDIVMSMIKHRLKKSENRVSARQCKVVVINTSTSRNFFDQNHIEGSVRSTFSIALMLNDDIVGVCAVRKKRGDNGVMEIARLCFRTNTHVSGGVSKLVKHAAAEAYTRGAHQLMTYSDDRLGGRCYENTCLAFDGKTVPRFWWTDFTRRYDRFTTRADSKNGITEKEAAESKGVVKIYGCGNSRYVMSLDTVQSVTSTSNGTT